MQCNKPLYHDEQSVAVMVLRVSDGADLFDDRLLSTRVKNRGAARRLLSRGIVSSPSLVKNDTSRELITGQADQFFSPRRSLSLTIAEALTSMPTSCPELFERDHDN